MILTITANAALDRVIFIPEFNPGTRMLAERTTISVGGKGFDTSVALAGLGVHSLAMGFLAGENGRRIEYLLRGYGVDCNLTYVEGETRLAHVIVESIHGRHSHVMTAGYSISPEELQLFISRYRGQVWQADWVVAAGSLAPGLPVNFYATVVEIAHQAGAQVLVDAQEQALRQSLPALPDIVKLNRGEFCAGFGYVEADIADMDSLLTVARQARQQHHLPVLIVSAAEHGLLALTNQGDYLAACPPQVVTSAAGAGDCLSAALTWRRSLGDDWPDTLRWAVAAGAAGVLTEATAELRMADVLKFLPLAELKLL
jgi:1-phosphofructokinase family hexose kinase